MNKQLFAVSLAMAHEIVQRYRDSVPKGMEFYNASWSTSDSNSSSAFSRTGATNSQSVTNLPSWISQVGGPQMQQATLPQSTWQKSTNFLDGLLGRDNTQLQGQNYLNTALNDINPNSFQGRPSLANLAAIDPTSGSYEQATNAKYQDLVKQGLAQAQTGPDMVRGGTNRSALMQGEAVNRMALERADNLRQAKVQDSGIVTQASNLLNTIESGRRAALLTGQNQIMSQYLSGSQQGMEGVKEATNKQNIGHVILATLGKLFGSQQQATSENTSGIGSGTSSTQNWGVGGNSICCFILLEALDGELPWYVRRARDIFYAEQPKRGVGYVRMARWLVPLMRRYNCVKQLVRFTMVQPCVKFGAWMFADESAKPQWRFYGPIVKTWFKLWEVIGG